VLRQQMVKRSSGLACSDTVPGRSRTGQRDIAIQSRSFSVPIVRLRPWVQPVLTMRCVRCLGTSGAHLPADLTAIRSCEKGELFRSMLPDGLEADRGRDLVRVGRGEDHAHLARIAGGHEAQQIFSLHVSTDRHPQKIFHPN
jgi:hypothetical protein